MNATNLSNQMLIECYRAIEVSSLKMLEAAKAEAWDDVVRCEGACAILIEQLRLRAKTETLDQSARDEKNSIMLKILRNDALIRNLVEPILESADSCCTRPKFLH